MAGRLDLLPIALFIVVTARSPAEDISMRNDLRESNLRSRFAIFESFASDRLRTTFGHLPSGGEGRR
jgi:hypothetical protein